MKEKFENLKNQYTWQLELEDSGSGNWTQNWFLDGEEARIDNTDEGMVFAAGPKQEDSSHAVLWTKQRFQGCMRVQFTMTRLDTINRFVNILYFQANGIGTKEAPKDIHSWREDRKIPYMATYFQKMDLLHMSYAAFDNAQDLDEDYIRIRRYPVTKERSFDQIEVEPTIFNTNFFKPNQACEMEVIKSNTDIAIRITGENKELYHHWDISSVDPVTEGPLGIRHMHQKITRYQDIKVFTASGSDI